MRYLSARAQHIGARRYQQDAVELAEYDASFQEHGGVLAVVCDGMGGMHHGDLASQTAIATLIAEYGKKTPEESIPDALLRSASQTNDRVVAAAHRMGVEGSMGTTLIAAAVLNQSYYYISVGDSALYHVHDGKVKRVNKAHIFGNMLDRAVETGTMTEKDAAGHPERESLTSFIGINKLQEIDANTEALRLEDGDTLLLATDGLFKTLDDSEIESYLNGHPQSWPSQLIVAVLEKRHRGQDNVSVLTVTDDAPGLGPMSASQDQSALTVEITAQQLEEHLRNKPPRPEESQRSEPREASAPQFAGEEESSGVHVSRFLLYGGILVLALLVIAAAITGYNMGKSGGQ